MWSDLLPIGVIMKKQEKFIKPAQFTENEILNAIISHDWPAGSKLPPERELCASLGVTRPTLREVLQRLSRDGWLTITHGKPTIVNDYKQNGGLGVLKTLVNHNNLPSPKLMKDWLEFRVILFPSLAMKSIKTNKAEILEMLNNTPKLTSHSYDFASYDWDLQMLLIKLSNNAIAQMLYNDLSTIYTQAGAIYFESKETKTRSLHYYESLKMAINTDENVKTVIETAMTESLLIWDKTING